MGCHRPASAGDITKSQVICWLTHLLHASACQKPKVGAEDMHPCLHLPWQNLRLAGVTLLSFQQSACTSQVSCVPIQENKVPLKDSTCHPVLASADIECYTAVDTMLDGADVVLQATAYEGANNLAMASRPGQRFWETAWGLIEQRSRNASLVDNVLVLSGPNSLSDALQSYLNLGADYWQKRNGDNVVDGDTIRVWPAGTFMCPCFLNDECYSNMTKLHTMYEVPENVTGLHRFQGSWHKAGVN